MAGGPTVQYGPAERERILAEVRRTPDRERDGTATWSLTTLQRALRRAEDGLPEVSTYTIWCVLHEAGLELAARPVVVPHRAWRCGGASAGEVEVHDPDAERKKGLIEQAYTQASDGAGRCGPG